MLFVRAADAAPKADGETYSGSDWLAVGDFEGRHSPETVRSAFAAYDRRRDLQDLIVALRSACGEFAFALTDAAGSVHLVRSDNGVAPLYWTREAAGRLVVGSDIAEVRDAAGGRGLGLDGGLQYLLSEYAYEPNTLFDGITAAPQGAVLELKPDGARTIRPFIRPFQSLEPFEQDEAWLVERYRELIVRAIERRLKHHPGVFLSGGIDSNALAVYLMRDLGHTDAVAATYTVKGVDDDEGPIAAEVAHSLGMRHYLLEVDPSREIDLAPTLARTAAPEAEANYIVDLSRGAARFAGRELTLLAGQDHRLHTPFLGRADAFYLKTVLDNPWMLGPIRLGASVARLAPGLGYQARRVVGIGARARRVEDVAAMRYLKLKSHLPGVSEDAIHRVADHFSPALAEAFTGAAPTLRSRFNAVMQVWWHGQGTWDGQYMRSSAAEGGQHAAMPYLDREVVEFCARLPYDLISRMIPGRAAYDLDKVVMVNKYFLRKALVNDLPERLLMRAKAVMPSAHLFMNGAFRGHLADLARPGGVWDTPVAAYLDRQAILNVLKTREGRWETAENPELWLMKNLMCLDVISRDRGAA
jgi:asparagine synthetase B (glutamine-hydrolysing)